VASLCLQIHGAMGYTNDSDVSVYYRRVKGWEFSFGNTNYHLGKLAEEMGF
jgi:alkylation response protein AidB-like acyl-CoA dehydrogenase